jgi:hypothetical protein
MSCTWVDCTASAAHPQVAKDGEVWADLCEIHHRMLEEVIAAPDAKQLLKYWIRAQGGAARTFDRTFGRRR